jgi:hypothetical protein
MIRRNSATPVSSASPAARLVTRDGYVSDTGAIYEASPVEETRLGRRSGT